jgi:hypothetical protein
MYSRTFLGGKTDLARRLAVGECGGTYDEAVLILSAVLSSLAATLWPGKGIDRRRFVEVWARYASEDVNAMRISVPLLAQHLHSAGDQSCIASLAALRPEGFRDFPGTFELLVVTGGDVDLSEVEVRRACPTLAVRTIRKFSYPRVFYENVRNGYVHEYGPTPFASRYPGGKSLAPIVTYLNSASPPFRKIHFNIEWLCAVVEAVAEAVFPYCCGKSAPQAPPWWLDGA